MPVKYVCHSRRVWKLAQEYGWTPGARYTNLRDVRGERVGFLDIDWKRYDYDRHISAARSVRPDVTVAQDVLDIGDFNKILDQAFELLQYSSNVIIVPKALEFEGRIDELIPRDFLVGYSVPTKYGGTAISLESFGRRKVHLLGGRPDVQRKLADSLNVASLDTNRFTLDASFGDYFDGVKFVPHPVGGYENCIRSSLENMNKIWDNYRGWK